MIVCLEPLSSVITLVLIYSILLVGWLFALLETVRPEGQSGGTCVDHSE